MLPDTLVLYALGLKNNVSGLCHRLQHSISFAKMLT